MRRRIVRHGGGLAGGALAVLVGLAGVAGCDNPPPPPTDGGTDGSVVPPHDGGPDTGHPTPDTGVDVGPRPDTGVDGGMLPTSAPTTFVRQAFGNFRSPTDAVVSPDGATFYFAAFDTTGHPAIFSMSSTATPGAATVGPTGAPLEYPSGLALACDGGTLYIADPVAGGAGSLFSMTAGGTTAPAVLTATGLTSPNAIAMDDDCAHLVVSGRDATTGAPLVARVPIAGGAATAITMGAPLVAPTGVYVDAASSVWVLDWSAEGPAGRGVLFHLTATAAPSVAASGLRLGTPAGVTFPAGGGRAIVATRDATGASNLTIVDATSGAVTNGAFTGVTVLDPGGLRSARRAGVFAIVDTEGAAIYRGQ